MSIWDYLLGRGLNMSSEDEDFEEQDNSQEPEAEEGQEEEQENEEDGEGAFSKDPKQETEEMLKKNKAKKGLQKLKSILKSRQNANKMLEKGTARLDASAPILPPISTPDELKAQKTALESIKSDDEVKQAKKDAMADASTKSEATKTSAEIDKEKVFSIKNMAMYIKSFATKLFAFFSSKMPILPYLLAALGIIFIIVVFIFVLVMMFGIDKDNPPTESYGASAANFYGVRVIYEGDEEEVRNQIITDYSSILTASITAVEEANPVIDITIEIPEDYDYFSEGETHQKSIITSIASAVYAEDNSGSSAPSTLIEIVAGIKYFGINETLHDTVAAAISGYINDNDLYTSKTTDELPADVENIIANYVSTEVAKYNARTEKLFIDEQILEEGKGYTLPGEKNYKALIYMPKSSIVVDHIWLATTNAADDIKITLTNGTKNVEFKQELGGASFEGSVLWESGSGLNITQSAFANIDTENPIKGSLSMLGVDNLEQAKDESGNEIENVYTFSKNALMLLFETDQAFSFRETEFGLG